MTLNVKVMFRTSVFPHGRYLHTQPHHVSLFVLLLSPTVSLLSDLLDIFPNLSISLCLFDSLSCSLSPLSFSLSPLRLLSSFLFSLFFLVIVLCSSEPSLKLPTGWVVRAHTRTRTHTQTHTVGTYTFAYVLYGHAVTIHKNRHSCTHFALTSLHTLSGRKHMHGNTQQLWWHL